MAITQADSTPIGQTEVVTPRFGSFQIRQALTHVTGRTEVLQTGKLISMAVAANVVHGARTAHQAVGDWYRNSIEEVRLHDSQTDPMVLEGMRQRGEKLGGTLLSFLGLVAYMSVLQDKAQSHNLKYF